jgi:hypothetical protein
MAGKDGQIFHRTCAMMHTGEYLSILQLFRMQDDHDVDPNTAFADMIGQLGHFATIHNARRGNKRIDFAASVQRGLRYFEEER